MLLYRTARNWIALGAIAGMAPAAQAQHVDGLVFQNGGQVQIGSLDVECFLGIGTPGCDPNGTTDRVFEGELEAQGTSPGLNGLGDFGFFAVPDGSEANLPFGGNLPGNAAHAIDIILAPNSPVPGASILFWDGSGAVDWSAVPNGEFFEITGNGGSGGVLDGSNQLFGVDLDPTAADGSFDTHPDYLLWGAGQAVDPSLGFYVIFGQTHVAGLATSNPWAIVYDFGVGDELLHEAAVDSVASFIPEPAPAALVALGLVGLAIRRRRIG